MQLRYSSKKSLPLTVPSVFVIDRVGLANLVERFLAISSGIFKVIMCRKCMMNISLVITLSWAESIVIRNWYLSSIAWLSWQPANNYHTSALNASGTPLFTTVDSPFCRAPRLLCHLPNNSPQEYRIFSGQCLEHHLFHLRVHYHSSLLLHPPRVTLDPIC